MRKLILLLFPGVLAAQDLHWSQPVTALHYINPAFTGVNGKFSINGGHRSQWNAIHSNFRTSYAAADYRLGTETKPYAFNLGGFLYNDNQGYGALKSNCFGLTISSLVKTGEQSWVGGGVSFQRINRTLISDQYSWGTQFSGVRYDPTLPSGERDGTVFSGHNNFQAGISYLYREGNEEESGGKRKFLAGYSADHLTRPLVGLTGGAERLSMKHCIYAQAYLPADASVALKPFFVFQAQGPYMECTIGALYRTAFGEVSRYTGIKKGAGFSLGAAYRVRDALIPTFEYEKDNVIIGFSYDINISRLTPVSWLRGGTEISLRITQKNSPGIQTVKPARHSTRNM